MSHPHGQIAALAALISDAAKVVEAQYASTERPYVPSLDDTDPHPFDERSSKELRTAIQIIEGACAQLSATVARPSHTIVNRLMGFYEPNCLNVALTFKIPDVLNKKPAGMHISEIGRETGIEEGKVGRILRLLASKHIFREVSENVFANNRLSVQLLSTNPLSSLGLHFTDECQKSTVLLSDVLADKEWGHSYAPNHTAFNKYTGFPDPLFVYYETDKPKGAERGARFGLGMIGWGTASEAQSVIHEFPWGELPDGATVCDVGGGIGNITIQLAKAYPKLQLILQDLPGAIQQAQNEIWPVQCPEAIAENRIEFKPLDFFAESPVSGCHIYYLKNIVHDWPDADCIRILANVREAMVPRSRLLVQEYILQHANRVPDDKSLFKQAPEPMLPNFGAGRIRQYNLDLDMMTALNSQERRLPEFIELGKAAGLKFVKLWDFGETALRLGSSGTSTPLDM
ncbi:3-O-methyltransferase 2 [Psilocybe cubensis]|uniref:3-O-methyltransferase 2 n=2 Tax=Psilocybe cubensis TaxID=181762 RepID=A0ACB8H5Q5_PSICU|nr:3-O-methyltransferase 2 [Psilocybe cubensis]KAH9483231.1 3-O-methyltransferase 2 [Psilocybe cubensis]